MIELQHALPEPDALKKYRDKNPNGAWIDEAFQTARDITRRQLNREQAGHCVYCESRLPEDDGHIEHIKPRSSYPRLVFDYSNLAHSCSARTHCGHAKGNSEIPIEPRLDCNRFFTLYASDGLLDAADTLAGDERVQVENTLRTLNLNDPALTRQRKNYFDTLRALDQPDRMEFLAASPFRWSLRGML